MKNIRLATYTFLNAACLFVLFLLMIEMFVPSRISFADYGAPLGLLLLFVLIPLGCIFLGKIPKHKLKTKNPAFKFYYQASKVFILAMWIVSWSPILFYGTFLLHHMNRPFFESNQGPDTEAAIEGFERHIHRPPPDTVTQLYFRGNPDMAILRFTLKKRESLSGLVKSLHLHKTAECHLNIAAPPAWWQPPHDRGECFSDATHPNRQGTHQLIYEGTIRRIHFMRFDP